MPQFTIEYYKSNVLFEYKIFNYNWNLIVKFHQNAEVMDGNWVVICGAGCRLQGHCTFITQSSGGTVGVKGTI